MKESVGMDTHALSPDQLAGQRLMVGFDGPSLNSELKYYIDTLKIGGVILFSRNVFSPEQLKQLCTSIQKYACFCRQPPLFIAIDQEGGVVSRLKPPFTQFPGNPKMRGVDDAIEFAQITSHELSRAGINMNMAPVMDVAPPDFNSIMADRVFGTDPERVSGLGGAVIEHLQKGNIMAVAKHFPGIGRTNLDSHLYLPVSDIAKEDLERFDIPPFRAAIEKKVCAMMLSHILYKKIDNRWPASLSGTISRDMLRHQLAFAGMTITDDLDMGAIEKHYTIETVIDRIFEADIDIALICHPGSKIPKAFQLLKSKLEHDQNSKEKFLNSVRRILETKNHWLESGK